MSYTYAHALDGGSASIGSIPVANSTNLLPVRNANGTIPYPSLSIINQVRQNQGLAPFTTDAQAAAYFIQNYVGGPQFGAEYDNADFDCRHIAVINFIYELPFGAGHGPGGGMHGFVGKLISAWEADGILHFQTGQPFTLLAGWTGTATGPRTTGPRCFPATLRTW